MSKNKKKKNNMQIPFFTEKELSEQFFVLRGRVDKYLKELKKIKKIYTFESKGGEDKSAVVSILRRLTLLESEIDSVAATINYFMNGEIGSTETKEAESTGATKDLTVVKSQVSGYDFLDIKIAKK